MQDSQQQAMRGLLQNKLIGSKIKEAERDEAAAKALPGLLGTPGEKFGATPVDDEGNPNQTPGTGVLGGQTTLPQFYAQLAGLGGDYTKLGIAGLAAKSDDTDLIRNLKAAGIKPGTPEFAALVQKKYENSERGEYFVPVQTAEGVMAFDARRGIIVDPVTKKPITNKPVLGSGSDPNLQRNLSANKELGKDVGTAVGAIGGKYDALDSVREAKIMLDKGIYSGFWAETQKNIAKATPGLDTTKAANTEQFMAHIGNVVIPRLKEFGGNDSNEEMRYLQKIMGGDITMEDKALRGVLESAEKKIAAGIKRVREQAKGANVPVVATPPNGSVKGRVRVDAQGNVID